MPQMQPPLSTNPIITRVNDGAPVLSPEQVPYPSQTVFNAGVAFWQGRYVMVFRNEWDFNGVGRFNGSNLGLATSSDGIDWQVAPEPVWQAEWLNDPEITRVYDPRLTVLEGRLYMCFAVDTRHGVRGGIGVWNEDLSEIEILSISVPENRNMVLFPEKVNDQFIRLERPMPVYSRGGDKFDTWLSRSNDLRYWGDSALVLGIEQVPFCNDKLGPAAPPIRTDAGWLTTFHSVDRDRERGKFGWEATWQKRYSAGIMLLDLADPSRLIGLSTEPLISPETEWEVEGFRSNVIFPTGMTLVEDEVRIYYGCSDTWMCLASADVNDLVAACTPVG
ncbi:glycoside hydrolase family 130 protein [Parenemella sanctibonifatiensis]|uniref:Glycosidase n=1 Tax=Parenemella sanctibonifatiensis TaxID=2016505 RepID=A0A255E9V0_9ACTN|nr:glycoside hydrolase family 130 protein [Parenemella sanctibonifatiensis]OYN88348.1 glycosidase [Parenemella sanctibonifatiensis]